MKHISLNNSNPVIGIFDSGLGGLTILNQLNQDFNNSQFIYFGDTAHLPYGTKSHKSIIRFCDNIVDFLISKGANIIVIACHSASAVALDYLKKKYSIPILGVIKPSIIHALQSTTKNSICVLGTSTTINSHTYRDHIKQLSDKIEIYEIACPLFVPIVEEGLEDSEIATLATRMYLDQISSIPIDTLILGCTHYPILLNKIKETINNNIQIINTGSSISIALSNIVTNSENISNTSTQYYVSDLPYRFNDLASKFLNSPIDHVQQISL
tara:strand:+ start:1226 stop:2032 length:807 start_codon:yes stop_codon:yes gene_type:complete